MPKKTEPGETKFRVRIDDERFYVADPVITGRQLLDAAGKRPAEEFLIFLKLRTGLLEEIRLDETVELGRKGLERFLTFKSDRSFRFLLDGRRFEWGGDLITGLTLKNLAGADPEHYGVWLEVRGGKDRRFLDDEFVSLGEKGLERFYTKELTIVVNGREKPIKRGQEMTFDQLVALAFDNPPTGEFICFAITYRTGPRDNPEGILAETEIVKVQDGMIFNVTPTDKS